MKRISTCVALFWVFCLGLSAWACDLDDEDGADVALVLSGGGALTATQVGAMQIIEELGVPIHCVLGTSMGSVTGAMYVSGYSPKEIEQIYVSKDWGAIFRGQIDRVDKPYLQKLASDEYFSDYFAGVGPEGVRLPGGLSSMSGLQSTYRDVFAHIPNATDFDENFRVPFRSVAMDLANGEAVAFDEGDLVQTILASMAVPGAFAPRNINGGLYVDGGMASQLPVRFAKQMGADIIIAIDTTVEPSPIAGEPSLTSTTQQIIQITVHRNRQEDVGMLGPDDLLITPDLTGLSSSNFNLFETGLESGRVEARKYIERLKAIAERAAPSRDREIDPMQGRIPAGTLELVNTTTMDDDVIRGRLDIQNSDLDDRAAVDQRLRTLSSFGAFGDIDLSQSVDGPYLKASPRAIGQNLLQGGFRASTTFDGDAQYSILGRVSRRPIGPRGGEASLSLQLGTDWGVSLEYYRPLGREGRFFVIPLLNYRSEEVLFDIADVRIGEFVEKSAHAHVRVGRELGRSAIFALEGVLSYGEIDPVVVRGTDNLEFLSSFNTNLLSGTSYELGGGGFYFGIDTQDRSTWPTSGFRLLTSGQLLYDLDTEEDTTKYNIIASAANEIGPVGVNFRFQAESAEGTGDQPSTILTLGGFRRISAFAENSVPNNQYVLAMGEAFYRLTDTENIVNFPFYVGSTIEYAAADFNVFQEGLTDTIVSGSLYIGGDTALGPIYFGTGFSDRGDTSVFLHFGRAF